MEGFRSTIDANFMVRLRIRRLTFFKDHGAQPAQLAAVLIAEFAGYDLCFCVNAWPHFVKKLDPFRRDNGNCLPLIFTAAGPLYQPSRLQPVNQTCDVRGAVEHTTGDFAAGMALGMGTSEDAQHIVLSPRDAMLFTYAVANVIDGVRGHNDA